MNSAIRRHHYRRLQKKRRGYWWSMFRLPFLYGKELGMIVATPHPCSCRGCGNPRKHENEKSIQERRNLQEDK